MKGAADPSTFAALFFSDLNQVQCWSERIIQSSDDEVRVR